MMMNMEKKKKDKGGTDIPDSPLQVVRDFSDGTVNTEAPAHMQKKARRQDRVLSDVLKNMSTLARA